MAKIYQVSIKIGTYKDGGEVSAPRLEAAKQGLRIT
jgi:hypothetical protein